MADLTPDLEVSLSWGSIAESFHSLRSLSVSCFQVILGLPGPRFPLTCMSKAILTAPLEHSICPYQRSLLSFSIKSRSSIPSPASSSMDLMVAESCGLTLQICLIITLSFRCSRWRQGFVTDQVSLAWSSPHTSAVHMATYLERKVAGREDWFQLLELLPGSFHTCCSWKLTNTGCWEHVS